MKVETTTVVYKTHKGICVMLACKGVMHKGTCVTGIGKVVIRTGKVVILKADCVIRKVKPETMKGKVK